MAEYDVKRVDEEGIKDGHKVKVDMENTHLTRKEFECRVPPKGHTGRYIVDTFEKRDNGESYSLTGTYINDWHAKQEGDWQSIDRNDHVPFDDSRKKYFCVKVQDDPHLDEVVIDYETIRKITPIGE